MLVFADGQAHACAVRVLVSKQAAGLCLAHPHDACQIGQRGRKDSVLGFWQEGVCACVRACVGRWRCLDGV